MSRPRSSALLRGLAPLGATVALLVGVPTGLAALVGWPLPTSLPDGDALSRPLNTGISDELIVNTLAVIPWPAWTQLALALTVQSVAVVRGRPPPDAPHGRSTHSRVAKGGGRSCISRWSSQQ